MARNNNHKPNMKKTIGSIVMAVLACIIIGGNARATTWDAVDAFKNGPCNNCFSIETNPNGQWSYGTLDGLMGGTFSPIMVKVPAGIPPFAWRFGWNNGGINNLTVHNNASVYGNATTVPQSIFFPFPDGSIS